MHWQNKLVLEMQIFLASCLFVLAVLGLAYVPGKLLLLLLNRRVNPLEEASLACSAGLLIRGLVYWVITFFNREHFYVI